MSRKEINELKNTQCCRIGKDFNNNYTFCIKNELIRLFRLFIFVFFLLDWKNCFASFVISTRHNLFLILITILISFFRRFQCLYFAFDICDVY